MRVGLNLLYMIPRVVGGTETYARGLLNGLADVGAQHEFVVYVNRESKDIRLPDTGNFRKVVCPINAIRRPVRYAWEQLILPRQLARDRIDVVHSLGYVGPVNTPCPHVLSIHDMNNLDMPQSVSGLRQRALESLVARAARNAARVLTISEFSRSRILHHLRLDPDRVKVTYLAGREDPTQPTEADIRNAITKYRIARPYIAAFSSPFPHKNMLRLVEAFGSIADQLPHQLVLIGHLPPDGEIPTAVARANMQNRVVITGYVPDEDVMPLIAGAAGFAFPSLYEGFGLPILDAQRAGVPIAASTAASVPEVAGDGALYFDPLNVPAIADALKRVADPAVARELKEKGTRNNARFTWSASATQTIQAYEEAR
jgi:glycosyltransferase involved in cell wall biosynthesis